VRALLLRWLFQDCCTINLSAERGIATREGALKTGEPDDPLFENCGFVAPSEVRQQKDGSSESQFPAIDLPDAGV